MIKAVPSHKFHRMLTKAILGKAHNDVNRLMDSTAYINKGRSHRRDIVHNPFFILAVTQDWEKFNAAVLHLIADNVVSDAKQSTKNRKLRKILDNL